MPRHVDHEANLDGWFGAGLGALTGMLYGIVLWLLLFFLLERNLAAVILWNIAGFALIGWFQGAIIADVFIAFFHFIWGLLNGLAEQDDFEPNRRDGALFYQAAVIGFVSGLAILLAWHG